VKIRSLSTGKYTKIHSDLERFMLYVKKDIGGCWEWIGQKCKDGYGKFTTGVHRNQKHFRSHRWITNAPKGKVAMHICDNPSCVNPAHIEIGNQSDNRSDCVAKRRHAYGPRHGRWKHGRYSKVIE